MEQTFNKILLQEITKLDVIFKSLINDINLNVVSKDELTNLNNKAYEVSQKLKSRIEDLEDVIEDSAKLSEIKSLKDQYLDNIKDLRYANLKAQLNFDIQARNYLIDNNFSKQKDTRHRAKANKDELMSTAVKLTTNLKDVTKYIANTVKQSEDNLHLLAESSSKIAGTSLELRTMDTTVTQSRKLLNKYDRRHTTDKILIAIALLFFFTAVLYVVNRRVSLIPSVLRRVIKARKVAQKGTKEL